MCVASREPCNLRSARGAGGTPFAGSATSRAVVARHLSQAERRCLAGRILTREQPARRALRDAEDEDAGGPAGSVYPDGPQPNNRLTRRLSCDRLDLRRHRAVREVAPRRTGEDTV